MFLATAKLDEVNKISQDSPIYNLAAMKQTEQLSLENETDANNKMKPIYSQQNNMLHKIQATIALIYMEYASKGVLQLTKIQKTNISKKIFNELENNFRALGKAEEEKVRDILSTAYNNTYYRSAAMLNKKLKYPSKKDIKRAVSTKIDGKLFSDRIWDNKAKAVKMLKKLVPDIINGKTTIDEAGNQIKKVFGVTANESYRLLITEVMRVQAQASTNAGKNLGCQKHMWNAKFENTCSYCVKMHGKIFDIDDPEAPIIPAHPYCKCIWVNMTSEDNNESLKTYTEDDKIKEIRDSIKSGKQPLNIEAGKQGKHILGHNNYIEGRSYLTISMDEAQKLISRYAGTGIFEIDRKGNVKNKELVISDKAIGMNIDNSTGEKTKTNRFYIHYSKKGTHIVPTLKGADKE
jgi:SPP1 gp7 family putative phage head morphogenesis protein